MQVGAAFLAGTLQSHAGQAVTYSRDGDSVEITATISQSEYDVGGVEAFHTSFRMKDFIVKASDLVLSTVQILPERGDRIVLEINDTVETYEVLPPGEDMDVYSNPDGRGVIFVIHTKLILPPEAA